MRDEKLPSVQWAVAIPQLPPSFDRRALPRCPTPGCLRVIDLWACTTGMCFGCAQPIPWPDFSFITSASSSSALQTIAPEQRQSGWLQATNAEQVQARLAGVCMILGQTDAAPLLWGHTTTGCRLHEVPIISKDEAATQVAGGLHLALDAHGRELALQLASIPNPAGAGDGRKVPSHSSLRKKVSQFRGALYEFWGAAISALAQTGREVSGAWFLFARTTGQKRWNKNLQTYTPAHHGWDYPLR